MEQGQQHRIEWFTLHDGYRCAARVWNVANPIAHVVFVHGIISHSGWYLRSCQFLADAGFAVHFLDRRGSGLNSQGRGDVDHYETWLRDVEDHLARLPRERPTLLVGISWGGKLVAAIARHRPELISGFGMLCPGLFARQYPSPLRYRLLRLAQLSGLGSVRVPIPLRDPTLFTDVPQWQAYIRHDPTTLRKVTIRFALADRQLTRYATSAPQEIHVPALLMLAGRDRIVDNQRVRQFFDQIATERKTLIEYPEAAHTFEFEPDPEPFFHDLCRWASNIAGSRAHG